MLNEIKYITDFKNTFFNQNELIKGSNGLLSESNENLKKIVNDLEEKQDKLENLMLQVSKNVDSFDGQNDSLHNQNIDKVKCLLIKAKNYETLKQKYQKTGETKEKNVKSIHESFDKFDHQELQFLDVKEREKEVK